MLYSTQTNITFIVQQFHITNSANKTGYGQSENPMHLHNDINMMIESHIVWLKRIWIGIHIKIGMNIHKH